MSAMAEWAIQELPSGREGGRRRRDRANQREEGVASGEARSAAEAVCHAGHRAGLGGRGDLPRRRAGHP